MKKINIIEKGNRKEINKDYFSNDVIINKFKKINLNKLFIYSNIIIIYLFLLTFYKSFDKKINFIKSNYNPPFLNNFYSSYYHTYDLFIRKYTRASIIWPLSKDIKFKPLMSDKEIKAFSYFMKPENIYFEFGSGGSTNIASFYNVKTYSVESDVKWHEKLKNYGIKANYITIDLNVTSGGYPGNDTNVNDWKKYIQAYKKEYNADIILIDGRFRVACALDIFNKIKNESIILIHDYEQRRQYHILENYYIKLKTWDTLALFIKNKNAIIPNNIYNFYLKEKLI